MSRTLDTLRVSEDVRRLNPTLFKDPEAQIGPTRAAPGEASRDKGAPDDASHVASEALLQAKCEKWLVSRGYGRRTPKKMQTHQSGKWFIHLHKTEKNPILCDLLLLDSDRGRYAEIELKAGDGRLTADQQALVFRGEVELAYNFTEFEALVRGWEKEDDGKETVV